MKHLCDKVRVAATADGTGYLQCRRYHRTSDIEQMYGEFRVSAEALGLKPDVGHVVLVQSGRCADSYHPRDYHSCQSWGSKDLPEGVKVYNWPEPETIKTDYGWQEIDAAMGLVEDDRGRG